MKLYRDESWLREKYWDEMKSTTEMANEAGCSNPTILRWMRKLGVPRRSLSEASSISQESDALYRNKKWLRQRYDVEQRTLSEMAEEAGCTPSTVLWWMRRHGIETRPKSEGRVDLFGDREWLYERYWVDKHTTYEMAEEAGCVQGTIVNWMERHSIPRRDNSASRRLCWEREDSEMRSEAWREAHAGAMRAKWSDPEWRARQVTKLRADEVRSGIARSVRQRWREGAYDGKVLAQPTQLEMRVAAALDAMGIPYEAQYRLEGTARVYDFCLPRSNLLIEVDGDFWHHSEWAKERGARERDRAKDQLAAASGYHLIRIREREVKELGAWPVVRNRIGPLVVE